MRLNLSHAAALGIATMLGVSLVAAAETGRVVNALRDGYARKTGIRPDVYVCVPSAGASRA